MIGLWYIYRNKIGAQVEFFQFFICNKSHHPYIIIKCLGQYGLVEFFLITGKSFKKIFSGSIYKFYHRCTIHPVVKEIDDTADKKLGADPPNQDYKYKYDCKPDPLAGWRALCGRDDLGHGRRLRLQLI